MNDPSKALIISRSDAERVMKTHLSELAGSSRITWNHNRRTIRALIDGLLVDDPVRGEYVVMTAERLGIWMIQDSKSRAARYVMQRVGSIRRFLKRLQVDSLISEEGLSSLGSVAKGVTQAKLIPALLKANTTADLPPRVVAGEPSGLLTEHIESYIGLHRALGKQYRGNNYDLREFDHFLRRIGVSSPEKIDAENVRQWLKPMTCIEVVRVRKMRLLHRFFEYLIGIGARKANPVTKSLLKTFSVPSTAITPYIFSSEQIKAILAAAKELPRTGFFQLRPEACFTVFALLYGLGLRSGEVCRLKLRDLDLSQRTLFIRNTKFHKSRFVPFGPRIKSTLDEYLKVRRKHLTPVKPVDPLFATLWRSPICDNTVRDPFTQILGSLGIDASPGRRIPRLHDLRHTFAVHRLTRWYREGIDVQSRLSLLSTFMGHTEVKNTQVYLTATDELLQQASNRFFEHFGNCID